MPARTSSGVGSALPCGSATKYTSAGSFSATSKTMSSAETTSRLSHRNTGGEKSSARRVAGHKSVPSWFTSAVSASAAFPARSARTTENEMHPFESTCSASSASTTRGPMHHRAPPPVTIAGGKGPNPVSVAVGASTGSDALTHSVTEKGEPTVGSYGESVKTSSASAAGGVTSTATFSGSEAERHREASSVTVVATPAASTNVTENGTGSRSPQPAATEAVASHRAARPSESTTAPARGAAASAPEGNDAGPTVAAVTATAPETSSCSDTVSPALASPG